MTTNFRTFIIGTSPRGKTAMTEKLKSIPKTVSAVFVAVVQSIFNVSTVSEETLLSEFETSGIDTHPCYVRHWSTKDALLKSQEESLEKAIRLAMRSVEKKTTLINDMVSKYTRDGLKKSQVYSDKISEVSKHMTKLNNLPQLID